MPGGELVGRGYIRPSFDRGHLRQPPVFWEVGWGAAEAVVDEETGAVRVSRYVGVADVGRAINPALAEGQDEGAAVQGLGHTLWESMIYEGAQLLNGSLVEYRVSTFEDLPEMFETVLLEHGNGPGPYGAKGMGEGGIGPVGPGGLRRRGPGHRSAHHGFAADPRARVARHEEGAVMALRHGAAGRH